MLTAQRLNSLLVVLVLCVLVALPAFAQMETEALTAKFLRARGPVLATEA